MRVYLTAANETNSRLLLLDLSCRVFLHCHCNDSLLQCQPGLKLGSPLFYSSSACAVLAAKLRVYSTPHPSSSAPPARAMMTLVGSHNHFPVHLPPVLSLHTHLPTQFSSSHCVYFSHPVLNVSTLLVASHYSCLVFSMRLLFPVSVLFPVSLLFPSILLSPLCLLFSSYHCSSR